MMRRLAITALGLAFVACGTSKSNPDGRLHVPDANVDAPPIDAPPPIDAMPPDAPPPDAMPGVTTLVPSDGNATITAATFSDTQIG
ncbi:MAG TPA: hypothetical protein VGO62_19445, partial [Myxococcota bacterium]